MDKNKIKSLCSLALTFGGIHWVPDSAVLCLVLPMAWFLIFRPLSRSELIMFIIGSVSIIGQNYSVLKAGGFAFAHRDFLLMPWYEPLMWGFYYVNIKRFVSEPDTAAGPGPGIKPLLGLAATGAAFTFASGNSDLLLVSTLLSTGVLVVMFHEAHDMYFAAYTLCLGFAVEVFGVHTGLWSYPAPDILGMPYWFATMWISVGILNRRLLIPLCRWADKGSKR